MSWERRQRGGLYYTRSTRLGGKIQRQYYGNGDDAEAAAAEDAARRAAGEARAQARRDQVAQWAALEGPLKELCQLSTQVLHAALLVSGYRRHDRGDWRRKRNANEYRKQTNHDPRL